MSDRDVQVRIVFGDLTVLLNEEGVSHSPDVLDDLCSRALTLFKDAFKETNAYEDAHDDEDAEPSTD